MNVTFSKSALPKTGALIAPIFENAGLSGAVLALDEATGGALTRAIAAADFIGKKGQVVDLFGVSGLKNTRISLVGAGPREELGVLAAEKLGAAAIRPFLKGKEKSVAIALDGFSPNGELSEAEAAARIANGARLRTYKFDKYFFKKKTDARNSGVQKIVIHTPASGAKKLYETYEKISDGVIVTRDLVSEPANVLYPAEFAERCKALESLGLEVTVLGEAQMKKLGMGSLLGVGQGSVRESKLVVMHWKGGKAKDKPLCFVGKGVTFDTGGISIKPPGGMEDMKWDMGGAGAVTGLMAALAGRKAKANVIGVLGLVENMPDGAAQRPGDVVTSMSGQTIEVINTDAEGRLVLADAMWYAQQKYKPRFVIDLATLTGAILVALAHEYAGLFSNDDTLAEQLAAAGAATGDEVWRMPVGPAFDDMIKSDIADMKNVGGRNGGSASAAAFLERFVEEGTPWVHLDIAGMAWNYKDKALAGKGGSGYGVRLLDEFVRANYE
ncbi:MAG: leucyl aminopeptidase [Pseudomonadota bacterium]